MTSPPLNYHPASNKVSSPSVVHVERAANGGVTVRVSYPPGTFRKMVFQAVGACLGMTVFPLVCFFWVFGRSAGERGAFVLLVPAAFSAFVIPLVARGLSRFRESYIFEADRDGITIQSYRGRREWSERLPRDQISDVRLGFGGGGRSGRSTAWLMIAVKTRYRANHRLLHDLGGNHLARVADALRAGLGLPRCSWPEGRVEVGAAPAPGTRRSTPNVTASLPSRPEGQSGKSSTARRSGLGRAVIAISWTFRPDPESPQEVPLVFGLFFVAMGLVLAVAGGSQAARAYHSRHDLRQTQCVLLEKRVTYRTGRHHTGSRHSSGVSYEAWTRVSYNDNGVSRTVSGDLFPTDEADGGRPGDVVNRMMIGASYPLWVDDRDASRVYLSRGESPWSYSLMVGGGGFFAVIGVVCAIDAIVRRWRKAVRPKT
jgi:hypothetical protein